VVEVAVVPGQSVAQGDPLFTMEAMKMEHAVKTPLTGTVESVRVAAGQQAEQGIVAVVVRPDGEQQ